MQIALIRHIKVYLLKIMKWHGLLKGPLTVVFCRPANG